MSRRKQTNPQHIETIKELTFILENGLALETGNDGVARDEHVCGKCRAQFGELGDFITHKRSCTRKRPVLLLSEDPYDEAFFKKTCPRTVSYPETVDDAADGGHNLTYEKSDSPYSEDMPSLVVKKQLPYDEDLLVDDAANKKMSAKNITISPLPHFPIGQLSDTNVTIKALENTNVAVAQQGADSLHLGQIATLQSALYALQQQQLVQIQVIQQLQTQLIGTSNTPTTTTAALTGSAALTPPQSGDSTITNSASTLAPPSSSNTGRTSGNGNALVSTSSTVNKHSDSLTDVNCSLALPPPPLPHEPNTLELLQRHTEQALQNTMSSGSFLLNGLSSLNNNSDVLRLCKGKETEGKSRDGDEAFFRHRCRFCGKLFGSDSALQIHIRSHTGERPFKCNVCGNRFSTKGNLKVHFQRHAVKYPHIKMNPNPVPEHMDSLHPPLEPPEERCSKDSSPMSCENVPPNLPVIPPATQIQEMDAASPEDATSQDATSPLQTRSISPNEVSNMTDVSDASGDCFATEDNMDKDAEFMKGEDEDQRSFASTPKALDEHKEEDIRSDDERKPLTGLDSNADASPSLVPPFVTTSTASFPSFFNPSFSPVCFPSGTTTSTVTTSASGHNAENINIHVDPAYYQNLLPKPGSNDNSWESLMEITKTSETSKLQQLVDNIEHKLSDPNQCVICHRVLSCKSALQMHYRTHTGERPFRCKICGRAFTTKGNLKTHMGVHRVKPPLRVLHQCPVCHKQFTNSLVLQQHIRTHTGEPTDMLPEHIMANEIKPHSMVHGFVRPMSSPLPHNIPLSVASNMPMMGSMEPGKEGESPERGSSPEPASDGVIKAPSVSKDAKSEESESSNAATPPVTSAEDTPTTTTAMPTLTRSVSPDRVITSSANFHAPYTASLAALENHVKAINSSIPQPLPFSPFNLGLHMGGFLRYDDPSNYNRSMPKEGNREKSPPLVNNFSSSPSPSRAGSECSVDDRSSPGSLRKADSPSSVVQSTPTTQSENGALDLTPRTSILSKQISANSEIALFSPLSPFLPSGGRSNTTCKVCFKTFACHSALEIHYRSHTKERPYKCRVCDRGFSTKGNMKQHMLTHKIRDLPAQLFTSDESNPSLSAPNTPTTPVANVNAEQEANHHRDIQQTPPINSAPQEPISHPISPKKTLADGNTILPLPKRPPGMPKHMCQVCNKPFSSASALQIHMRTHTGDKPFKCTICGRAFTTKGNLKVHMGTHMWNSHASRRGRRMSLELPGIPLAPGKPGDLAPPRHDLYFPYLPPAYVNGLTNTPKMNEISVIQTAGVTNGSVVSSPLNLNPAVTSAADLPRQDREKNRKSPIVSSGEINSTVHQQGSPPASWSWKIACNICNKICSSSTELEMHIQCHYQPEGGKEEGNCASSGERVSS